MASAKIWLKNGQTWTWSSVGKITVIVSCLNLVSNNSWCVIVMFKKFWLLHVVLFVLLFCDIVQVWNVATIKKQDYEKCKQCKSWCMKWFVFASYNQKEIVYL